MSDAEELNEQLMADLRIVSVATLTTVLFKRGFRNQFLQDIAWAAHSHKFMRLITQNISEE